jgi:hypothetical protein
MLPFLVFCWSSLWHVYVRRRYSCCTVTILSLALSRTWAGATSVSGQSRRRGRSRPRSTQSLVHHSAMFMILRHLIRFMSPCLRTLARTPDFTSIEFGRLCIQLSRPLILPDMASSCHAGWTEGPASRSRLPDSIAGGGRNGSSI